MEKNQTNNTYSLFGTLRYLSISLQAMCRRLRATRKYSLIDLSEESLFFSNYSTSNNSTLKPHEIGLDRLNAAALITASSQPVCSFSRPTCNLEHLLCLLSRRDPVDKIFVRLHFLSCTSTEQAQFYSICSDPFGFESNLQKLFDKRPLLPSAWLPCGGKLLMSPSIYPYNSHCFPIPCRYMGHLSAE